MIKKQFMKTKCKVTFRLTKKDVQAENVSLLGDFNNWDTKATPLEKLKTGEFKIVIDLDKNRSYQFRYLLENSRQ